MADNTALQDPAGSSRTRSQTMARGSRLALIASLYSTQNLSLAAFNYTFLIAAQNAGVSLELIGAATGVAMILVLKFVWAPLVDRVGSRSLGHYRGWIIACQSALTIGALALAALDPGRHFASIMIVFALIFLFAGTQDVATDAATTRLLDPQDRGIGNGIQSAGASFAQIVGGGLLLLISGSVSWSAAMVTLAVFSGLPLILVARWRESETTDHLPTPHVSTRQVLSFFRQPGVVRWTFAVLPLYVVGGVITYNVIRPLLTDAGWSEARIGTIVVIGGGTAGVLAGVAAGWLISRVGRQRSMVLLGIAQVIGTAVTIWLTLTPTSIAVAAFVTAISNASFAATGAFLYTIAMDLTRPESSGTDFTAFSTLIQIVMVIGGGLGIALAGVLGFTVVAIGATAVSAAGIAIATLLARPVIQRAEALATARAIPESENSNG